MLANYTTVVICPIPQCSPSGFRDRVRSWGFRKMTKRGVPPPCDAKRINSYGLLVDTGGKEFQRLGITSEKLHSELW